MSRISNHPIFFSKDVVFHFSDKEIKVEGPLGFLECKFSSLVVIEKFSDYFLFSPKDQSAKSISASATVHAIIRNMIQGVLRGFEKRLNLVGVGFRAQLQEGYLNLSLGYSHQIFHRIRSGISIELPSPVEIVVKGIDKQIVGQEAAEIRAYRAPEPYKGKGIRYIDENVVIKEAKKK